MSSEYSYQDVAEHNTKKDVWVVIHGKVYDVTKFVDEHPPDQIDIATALLNNGATTTACSGGEEVVLDVGGQDATEAFEDVGHSDEAREILDNLLVGILKRESGDHGPKLGALAPSSDKTSSAGLGVTIYALALVGGVIAYGAYQFLHK